MARKPKTPAIIRMRANNMYSLELNDHGHLEYMPAGHKLEILREGSEEWEPIEIEASIVETRPDQE